MTSKKHLVRLTFIITVIAMLSVFTFHFLGSDNDFWIDFSFAIMGSAFLGFLMSLTEYFVVRKSALINYYMSAKSILEVYKQAKFFYTEEPVDLLKAYYLEKYNSLPKHYPSDNTSLYSAKDELFNYIRNIALMTKDVPEPDLSVMVQKSFEDKICQYDESLKEVMDSYIAISKMDFSDLKNAYWNLDFLFGNDKFRKWIKDEVHLPLIKCKKDINEISYHFKMFKQAQNGNKAVMIGIIENLQSDYYEVIDKSNENEAIIIVFRKFYDSMIDKVEQLRCKIYRQDYIPSKHYPFMILQWMLRLVHPVMNMKKRG